MKYMDEVKMLTILKQVWGVLLCILFGLLIWLIFDNRWLPVRFIGTDILLLILVAVMVKSQERKIEGGES